MKVFQLLFWWIVGSGLILLTFRLFLWLGVVRETEHIEPCRRSRYRR